MTRLILLTLLFGVPLALRPLRQIQAWAAEQVTACHTDRRGIAPAAEMFAESTNRD